MAVGSILLLAATLLVFLAPIVVRGSAAFVFQGTVEYRRLMFEIVGRGRREAIAPKRPPPRPPGSRSTR